MIRLPFIIYYHPWLFHPSFLYPQLEGRKRPRSTTSDRLALSPPQQQQKKQASTSSFHAVLSNPDLLATIMRALLPGGRASVPLLGKLACINKTSKRISRQDSLWAPITAALLPVTTVDDQALTRRQRSGEEQDTRHFAYLRDYGKSLLTCPMHMQPSQWFQGLIMGVEIWEEKTGLQIYSASGSIDALVYVHGDVSLGLKYRSGKDVIGPAFSAARFSTIGGYQFEGMADIMVKSHLEEALLSLCIRVTITDDASGKMAVVWRSRKATMGVIVLDLHPIGQVCLRPGSMGVWTAAHPLLVPGHNALSARIDFVLEPEAYPVDVCDVHKRWRWPKHDRDMPFPFFQFAFFQTSPAHVSNLFRTLLR